MVDPMDALVKLQKAIGSGVVRMNACDLYPNLGVWMDEPAGKTRFTYAKIIGSKVEAIAMFVHDGYIEHVPCFQVGYAVVETMRQQGVASDLVSKAVEEMRNGLGRNGAKSFYLEAVVGVTNLASTKLASRLLSDTSQAITDEYSGEPALRYLKLFECES